MRPANDRYNEGLSEREHRRVRRTPAGEVLPVRLDHLIMFTYGQNLSVIRLSVLASFMKCLKPLPAQSLRLAFPTFTKTAV